MHLLALVPTPHGQRQRVSVAHLHKQTRKVPQPAEAYEGERNGHLGTVHLQALREGWRGWEGAGGVRGGRGECCNADNRFRVSHGCEVSNLLCTNRDLLLESSDRCKRNSVQSIHECSATHHLEGLLHDEHGARSVGIHSLQVVTAHGGALYEVSHVRVLGDHSPELEPAAGTQHKEIMFPQYISYLQI